MNGFIKGMDISTLIEEEACGAVYYDENGKPGDLLRILSDHGVNSVRLRLWNDPYDAEGRPYGAGTNDLAKTIELAKRAKAFGMSVLLDFHYSDFWADPGKQTVPKAWAGLDVEGLTRAVYDYTFDTISQMRGAGVEPDLIQIGNEITNGLLWPTGRKPEYDNIASYISSGIRAVKDSGCKAKIMIHLDNGGNNEMYVDWFDHYFERGEDFDIIGLSYYPFWHGTIGALEANMKDMIARYGKDIIVAEVSMGFSTEDYRSYEGRPDSELKGMATRAELLAALEYPMTVDGQSDFMVDVMGRIASLPEGKGLGFYYWEPGWIPVPGCGWAEPAALEYTGEKGPGGNEWANQALFDYDGKVLKTLGVIRDFKGRV